MESPTDQAWALLARGTRCIDGEPVGVVAAQDDSPDVVNYDQVFVRDQALVALAQLLHGHCDMARNVLDLLARLQFGDERGGSFHPPAGAIPVSFAVEDDRAVPDHGQHSIARVAAIDGNFWWLLLLRVYLQVSGDTVFVGSAPIQRAITRSLDLILAQQLTLYPVFFVPDGSFMIDRRLGT